MKLKIDKVGIIDNSEIDINGLTVITGRNNSGKSTVGKTLYSLVESVCNIDEKIENDKYFYLRDSLRRVNGFFPASFSSYVELLKDKPEFHNLVSFFDSYPLRYVPRNETESYLESVSAQLESLNIDISLIKKKSLWAWANRYKEANFEQDKLTAVRFIKKYLSVYKTKENVADYVKKNVINHLSLEFSEQIHPVAQRDAHAFIELKDDSKIFFSMKIKDGKLEENKKVFEYKPYENVFFIDSPFVLDNLSVYGMGLRSFIYRDWTVVGHQAALKRALDESTGVSTYDQIRQEKSYEKVLELFSKALQGRIQKNERGAFFKDANGNELKLENLATGSKILLILKQLVESSRIHSDTLLILDEPEAHLHPEWQNLFAEIIVRLVRDVGCHVVLTTHSINFMLALDTLSKKYKILEKTSFYATRPKENNFVSYEELTGKKEKIYEDFAQWFSIMKRMHDSIGDE